MLAAVKKLSPSCGSPVANMWCTHRPNADERRRDQRQHHRRVAEDLAAATKVGMIADIIPSAGMKMM